MTPGLARERPAGPHVDGYCPNGCGKTLLLGPRGRIVCAAHGCPNPAAAAQLLDTSPGRRR